MAPTAAPEFGDTPDVGWTLDAAETFGRSFAAFRDPRFGSEFDSDTPGFIDGGDTLVTLIGLPNPRGYSLDRAAMVGVRSTDGDVRWRTIADNLGGCADAPLDGKVVCYTNGADGRSAIVSVDVETGALTRTESDWMILALEADGNRIFIAEGNPEDNDVEVHAGTPLDPDVFWTNRFDVGAAWEDAFGQMLSTGHGVGVLELGGDVVGFDLESGRQTWTRGTPECIGSVHIARPGVVAMARTDCESGRDLGAEAVDTHGRVIASSEGETSVQLEVDEPSADTPLILGDSAYDRRGGERIWTAAELSDGAVTAVTGDTVLVRRNESAEEAGLDAHTGEVLWRREADDTSGTPAVHDGRALIAVGSTSLSATDIRSGEREWVMPFTAIVDEDRSASGSPTLRRSGEVLVYTTDRSMAGLVPG
ncbi:PQQ-like domain protein [Rhodococcus sp. MTM3W5.2]|uniref:outer membrane protein assembly factor BamB family protein n=1 Tax=Rhodococcus sp. MTM3W5.2 TaxID=1805827 RepID=UPI00097926A9|nr:PQQ-binding-like beta-propeller repeat protein [Rhodococcus sp. MTM3W5.2]AQA24146.1 PQQ-like domain protein [Rhodococcus sp. MTM3W5.2]